MKMIKLISTLLTCAGFFYLLLWWVKGETDTEIIYKKLAAGSFSIIDFALMVYTPFNYWRRYPWKVKILPYASIAIYICYLNYEFNKEEK